MRVPNHFGRRPVGFNMTPMIDVVFLLIIFFLVSSHLARREQHIELDLPTAASGEDVELENTPRITFNIRSNGEVLVAGNVLHAKQIRERMEQAFQENRKDLEVRIRSDRSAHYEMVEPVMKAASDLGITRVTYSVIGKK